MRFNLRQILLIVALFGGVFSTFALLNQRFSVQSADHTMISISPDGGRMAAALSTMPIQVWDTGSNRRLARLRGHESLVQGVDFANSEELISVSFDNSIRCWNWKTENQLAKMDAGQGAIGALCLSPDRKRIATGGNDGTIKIWDLETKNEITRLTSEPAARVTHMAFSPDQRWLATVDDDGAVRVWDVEQQNIVWRHAKANAAHIYGDVEFSPDGILSIACHGLGKLELREIPSGELVGELTGPARKNYSAVTFSPDGTRVALGHTHLISIHDWPSREHLRTFAAHQGWVDSLAFTHDGKQLISGCRDNSVMKWDVATGGRLAVLQRSNQALPWDVVGFAALAAIGWIFVWRSASRNTQSRLVGHQRALDQTPASALANPGEML